MNDTAKNLTRGEQELLIKLYANRMEQAMNKGNRDDAVTWMNAMYDEIKKRNAALMMEEVS